MFLRHFLSLVGLAALLGGSTAWAGKGGSATDKETRPRGGWSSTGGGGGVACFATADQARAADEFISKNEMIPAALLDQARVQVLERWEMDQLKQKIWAARDGETWQQHLATVQNSLRIKFPLFMYRLDQAADWIRITSWEESQSLQKIDDAEPIRPLTDECRRIQLVARFSNGNNAMGAGPAENAIQVKIVFVKAYFDRLSPTDQAMLMFHEQLYILAQATGHGSSDTIRQFVRIFFDDLWPRVENARSPLELNAFTFMLKYKMIDAFGDYVRFFAENDTAKDAARTGSARHFRRFLERNTRMRQRIGKCHAEGGGQACLARVMDPAILQHELDAEDAFIYLVYFGMERSERTFNADQIMDPTERDPALYAAALDMACTRLVRYRTAFAYPKLVEKALEHCAVLRPVQSTRD